MLLSAFLDVPPRYYLPLSPRHSGSPLKTVVMPDPFGKPHVVSEQGWHYFTTIQSCREAMCKLCTEFVDISGKVRGSAAYGTCRGRGKETLVEEKSPGV